MQLSPVGPAADGRTAPSAQARGASSRVVDWFALADSNLPEAAPRPVGASDPGVLTAFARRLAAVGATVAGVAKRAGRAIVAARMEQARRIVDLETSLRWTEEQRQERLDTLGSRYY